MEYGCPTHLRIAPYGKLQTDVVLPVFMTFSSSFLLLCDEHIPRKGHKKPYHS